MLKRSKIPGSSPYANVEMIRLDKNGQAKWLRSMRVIVCVDEKIKSEWRLPPPRVPRIADSTPVDSEEHEMALICQIVQREIKTAERSKVNKAGGSYECWRRVPQPKAGTAATQSPFLLQNRANHHLEKGARPTDPKVKKLPEGSREPLTQPYIERC